MVRDDIDDMMEEMNQENGWSFGVDDGAIATNADDEDDDSGAIRALDQEGPE